MQGKIAILLPYKDQFIKDNAGSASIWVKDFSKNSGYRNNTTVFGFTNNTNKIFNDFRYINLKFSKFGIQSNNLQYVNKFIDVLKKKNFSIIEIHNRPSYILHIEKYIPKNKYILVIHNNPQSLRGAVTPKDRKKLIKICSKIVFVSNWVKEKFFEGLDIKNHEICQVVYPAINKISKLPKKEKLITFVGKLNHSKGYDTFGKAIIKILKKYKDWKSIVIGDEPREKYNFKHNRLFHLGWITHDETMNIYKKSSISVVPSHWEEPFGRTSLEAASRGCATILSRKGGLPETIPYGIYLNRINQNEIFKKIKLLITNKKLREAVNSWNNYLDKESGPTNQKMPSYAHVAGAIYRKSDPSDIAVTAAGGLVGEVLQVWRPRELNTHETEWGFSCMSYEISGALGIKMANPKKEVIAFVGDGSYLLYNSDIYSSVITNHKLIIVVCDNGGHAVINRLQLYKGGKEFNCLFESSKVNNLKNIDFAKHAESLGATGENVSSISELEAAFMRAKKSKSTYVISIKTDGYQWLEGSAYWESPTLQKTSTKENEKALKEHLEGKSKQRQGV